MCASRLTHSKLPLLYPTFSEASQRGRWHSSCGQRPAACPFPKGCDCGKISQAWWLLRQAYCTVTRSSTHWPEGRVEVAGLKLASPREVAGRKLSGQHFVPWPVCACGRSRVVGRGQEGRVESWQGHGAWLREDHRMWLATGHTQGRTWGRLWGHWQPEMKIRAYPGTCWGWPMH